MEISVISGKGGTGKSSITSAFAALGQKVILADCDVDAANQYLMFNPVNEEESVYVAGHKAAINNDICNGCGLCMKYCRFDAISEKDGKFEISEVNCDGCFLCQHVCPQNAIIMEINDKSRMYYGTFRYGKMVYGRLAPGEENSGKLVNMVREKAKEAAAENDIDIILIDGPPGTGCPVISSITGTDKIVIVTEPTCSGLSDLQRVYNILKSPGKAYVIINKADLNPAVAGLIMKWCNSNDITFAGSIPFDLSVTEAMVQSKTINEYCKNSPVTTCIGEIWERIIDKNRN